MCVRACVAGVSMGTHGFSGNQSVVDVMCCLSPRGGYLGRGELANDDWSFRLKCGAWEDSWWTRVGVTSLGFVGPFIDMLSPEQRPTHFSAPLFTDKVESKFSQVIVLNGWLFTI